MRIVLPVLVLALLGCGANRIIVNVDIASFLPGEATTSAYGETVPIPPGVSVTVPVASETVVTPDGLKSVASVEEADLRLRIAFDNTTGQATGAVRVRFAPAGEDPSSADPFELAFQVEEGAVTPAEETIPLTDVVEGLFLDGSFELAVEIEFDTRGSGQNLRGSYEIEILKARVVTNPRILG